MINKLTLCGMFALSLYSCQKEHHTTTATTKKSETTITAKYSGTTVDLTDMYLTSAGTIHNQLMEDIRDAYPSGVDFTSETIEDITYPFTNAYMASFGGIGTQTEVDVIAYIHDYHYCRHHRPRYLYSKDIFDSEADDILEDINGSTNLGTLDKQVLTNLMNAAKLYLSNGNHLQFQTTLNNLKLQACNGMEEQKVDVAEKNPLAIDGNKSLVVVGIAQAAYSYQMSQPALPNLLLSDPDEVKGPMPLILGSTYGSVIATLKLTNQNSLKALGGIVNGGLQSTAFMELDIQ